MPRPFYGLLPCLAFAASACGRTELQPGGDGAGGAGGAVPMEACSTLPGPSECTPEFTPLFDGANDTGWTFLGGGSMVIQDGYARTRGNGRSLGLWAYTAQTFGNFQLEVQFRQQTASANSGIFVRFPDPRGNVLRPISEGYEIQIGGKPGSQTTTGAFYDLQAADPSGKLLDAGGWNELMIQAVDQSYEVSLNGQLINTFAGRRSLSGYVGVQVHDAPSDIVDVRLVQIRELP